MIRSRGRSHMTKENKLRQPHIPPTLTKKREAENELLSEIGERLRQIRFSKNWTQDKMAEHLGIAKAFYGKIERGESRISLERLVLLRNDLHVDLNYLLTGQEMTELPVDIQELSDEKKYIMEQIWKYAALLAAEEKGGWDDLDCSM